MKLPLIIFGKMTIAKVNAEHFVKHEKRLTENIFYTTGKNDDFNTVSNCCKFLYIRKMFILEKIQRNRVVVITLVKSTAIKRKRFSMKRSIWVTGV